MGRYRRIMTASAAPADRAEAIERDARLEDIDWSVPPPGAVVSSFAAPSGSLAAVALGEPARGRIVLVPGATGSKEDFAHMLPDLAAAGYRVESFDLAGQHGSAAAGPPAGEPYTDELFDRDLVAFLRDGGPAHLLGYSFGGMLAQRVAVRHPELVRSLALLTTPPATGNVFRGMKVLGPIAGLAGPRTGAALLIWGVRWNLNRVRPGRLAFVRSRFAFTRRSSVDDMVGLMMRAPDLRAAVRALPVPKLVATGTHDLWPVAAHERYASDIGAELHVYDTGHSPCETTPHQLCADLLSLYSRTEE